MSVVAYGPVFPRCSAEDKTVGLLLLFCLIVPYKRGRLDLLGTEMEHYYQDASCKCSLTLLGNDEVPSSHGIILQGGHWIV